MFDWLKRLFTQKAKRAKPTYPYEAFFYDFSDLGENPEPASVNTSYAPGTLRKEAYKYLMDKHPDDPNINFDWDSNLSKRMPVNLAPSPPLRIGSDARIDHCQESSLIPL